MRRLDPATVELLPSIIGLVFGLVFVLANRPFPPVWAAVALVVGLLLAALDVALLVAYARAPRRAPGGTPTVRFDGRYRVVVAVEVVALFGGLFVINGLLGRPDLGVSWVAIVVGVHFLGLGVGQAGAIVVLGAALTALGVLGMLLGLLTGSAAAVAAVAGVGSGIVLLVAVGLDLRRRRQLAAA